MKRFMIGYFAAVLAVMTALFSAPFAQAEPPASGFAYVWASSPSTTDYVAPAAYSRSSAGGANRIHRWGPGDYTVYFTNLGVVGGVVHTTAYGSTVNSCMVADWAPSGIDLAANIRCHAPDGALADTQFTASYTYQPSSPQFGHVWNNLPTEPVGTPYTPHTAYQFNSTGATNQITRDGPGLYQVRLPGLGKATGHVQVTAYGAAATRCKVTGWGPSGSDQLIGVRCGDLAGTPLNTTFTLTYVNETGILGATKAAYAWANDPSSPIGVHYEPSLPYQYNSAGTFNTIARWDTGLYQFNPPLMPLGNGTAHITAYGSGAEHCQVLYWNGTDGVRIQCRTPAGIPVDTQFDVAFQY